MNNSALDSVHLPGDKWREDRKRYVLQRERMLREHPYCHWCGCKVFPPDQKDPGAMPSNMATIDHLYPRGHPKRLDGNPTHERRRVLSCKRCNSARPNPYAKPQEPRTLEEIWRASRQWPRMAYQHGALPGEV